jgi:hypothetical protein
MGLLTSLKHVVELEKLFKEDLKRRKEREEVIAKGITEDLVKELIRTAETGVTAELIFPTGAILRVTRTLSGFEAETKTQLGNGLRFQESF